MSGSIQVARRSARADRLRALVPRIALFGIVGLLALAGLRSSFATAPLESTVRAPHAGIDQGAQTLAERFARAYLTWDGEQSERRERELASFLSDELEPDAGLTPGDAREVLWTAVEADSVLGGRHTITVAAQTNAGLVHLAVPVARDERGFLYVPSYPALVGPPATTTAADVPPEPEVEDRALRTVAERAVGNYLAGERRDLLADLAPNAVVSLPAEPLRLRAVQEITWAGPGHRVAVLVEAEDAGESRWTLRYELAFVRRDRWYVRALHVDPRHRGGAR